MVITFERTLMVDRRGHGPGLATVQSVWDERARRAAGLDEDSRPGARAGRT